MTTERHLTSEEVAAYLDNTLTEAECARIKSHLADCDVCREEIVSVSKVLHRAPRSRRRILAFSAMAAAAVLAVVLVRPSMDFESPASSSVRDGAAPFASEGVSGIRAVAPVGRQTRGDGILFVWHPASPGSVYRLTVTDDLGRRIWVGSATDTTLPLPNGVSLIKDGNYHWYVDVLQPDGTSATTGITSFQVAR